MVTKVESGMEGGDKLGVWDQQIQTTIYKIDKQQGLTVDTENYIQYLVISYNGKESEKEYTYICLTESHCCTSETSRTLQINYTSKKKSGTDQGFLKDNFI